ncbi:MAG: endolytic transglycosylase MltG [Paracoccaceae bacterium]
MWRHIASNALTLLVLALVVAGGLVAWGQRQFTQAGPLAQAICLRVEQGATLSAVSNELVERGAVSNGRIFRIGADYSGKAESVKFGSYLVEPGASMSGILDDITAGGQSTCGSEVVYRIGVLEAEVVLQELDPATNKFREVVKFVPGADVPPEYAEATQGDDLRYRVVLAEGATSWQVVESLKQAEFLTGEIAAVPPEGSLSPDSYEVPRDGDRAAILTEMQARQQKVLADAWAERAADLPYDTPEAALIMASIVEKETGIAEERGRVASVFVNRLRQGIRLQTDPTVIYGVTNGQGALGRGLRQSELRRETPYNTYVIDGLPPTPIANPGAAAIRAAVNPDTTPYIYFVADGTGGHAFAETLAEHNENVARWREIEAQQQEEAGGN